MYFHSAGIDGTWAELGFCSDLKNLVSNVEFWGGVGLFLNNSWKRQQVEHRLFVEILCVYILIILMHYLNFMVFSFST